jgi:AbrB family looped-hinge helix DNA binding protein
MEVVKVSSKGQIVIPKSLRLSQRINTGDSFLVVAEGNELRFKPAQADAKASLAAVSGILHRPKAKQLKEKQVATRIANKLRKADSASKSK